MTIIVRATYDGETLRPECPVDLRPQTTYVIRIEQETMSAELEEDDYPLAVIRKLATDMGVTDLSTSR